jgi:Small subunit of serine palmitoyltransferase-like
MVGKPELPPPPKLIYIALKAKSCRLVQLLLDPTFIMSMTQSITSTTHRQSNSTVSLLLKSTPHPGALVHARATPSFDFTPIPGLPITHTSFDVPQSPAWHAKSPPNRSGLRRWFERTYYQYEVTWGVFMLTRGEKFIINSLVLTMFSLIGYGVTKLAIFQLANIRIFLQFVAILLWESLVTLHTSGYNFVLHTVLELQTLDSTKTVSATAAPSYDL